MFRLCHTSASIDTYSFVRKNALLPKELQLNELYKTINLRKKLSKTIYYQLDE